MQSCEIRVFLETKRKFTFYIIYILKGCKLEILTVVFLWLIFTPSLYHETTTSILRTYKHLANRFWEHSTTLGSLPIDRMVFTPAESRDFLKRDFPLPHLSFTLLLYFLDSCPQPFKILLDKMLEGELTYNSSTNRMQIGD